MINNSIVFSLGSNLGNSEDYLNKAVSALEDYFATTAVKSSLYVSKPWGFESDNEFLNQCLFFNTKKNVDPFELLKVIQEIEKKLGRIRKNTNSYTSRKIDIDLLYMGQLILTAKTLTIPHPYIEKRNFVLYPLAEILPDFIDPRAKKRILTLKKESNDRDIPIKRC